MGWTLLPFLWVASHPVLLVPALVAGLLLAFAVHRAAEPPGPTAEPGDLWQRPDGAWDLSGPTPRPWGSAPCLWCGFWHFAGEEPCPDIPRLTPVEET